MGYSQQGSVFWIVGVPAAGKTTLARGLVAHCHEKGIATLWLDSDALRAVLTPNATYNANERDYFYRVLGHLAVLGAQGGVCVIISATASKRSYRDSVRESVQRFYEIYITCEIEEAKRRDPKGLYKKARDGAISNMPGHDNTFEEPSDADLVLDSTHASAEALLAEAIDALGERLRGG